MTDDAGDTIFFEGQILEAEAPAKALHLPGRWGVDGGLRALCNGAMATARTGSASAGLEARFEELGVERARPAESEALRTGVDVLDDALEGGLSSGLLTELVESRPSGGGQATLLHLLAGMRRAQRFAALVDGSDSFDPQSSPEELLEHLLWARCRSAGEAMKVADALLRDENLGMVLVDLRGCPARELQRVKSADWYRLQRLTERSSAYVCVFTPQALIPSAQVRVSLRGQLSVGQMDASLAELTSGLEIEVQRRRKRARGDFAQLVQRRAVG